MCYVARRLPIASAWGREIKWALNDSEHAVRGRDQRIHGLGVVLELPIPGRLIERS